MKLRVPLITVLLSLISCALCAGQGGSADGKPLVLDASVSSDTQMKFGAASSITAGRKWSTDIYGNVSGNLRSFDRNGDGYMDTAEMLDISLGNSWLYMSDGGTRIRFGVDALQNGRRGGQYGYDPEAYMEMMTSHDYRNPVPWGTDMLRRSAGGFVSSEIPLKDDGSRMIRADVRYSYNDMDMLAGSTRYLAGRHSSRAGVSYMTEIGSHHTVAAGLEGRYDVYDEDFLRVLPMTEQGGDGPGRTGLLDAGVFGEYVFRYGDRLTADVRLGGHWYSGADDAGTGFRISPDVSLRYSPDERLVISVCGRRRLEYADPLMDNMGVFYTGKTFMGDWLSHTLEDAWTYGGDVTVYLPFGASSDTYLSLGYSRTQFAQQMVVDYEYGNTGTNATQIWFYSLDGRRSYTDTFIMDFKVQPVERFTVDAHFRYTDARIEYRGADYPVERPLTGRFKGTVDLQYETGSRKWMFGITASLYGPSRVYRFMEDDTDENGNLLYRNGRTPVYSVLDCRIARRFRLVEIYLAGENLTDFRQKNVILGSVRDEDGTVSARQPSFDASAVWGPLLGVRIYAGVKFSLDKPDKRR